MLARLGRRPVVLAGVVIALTLPAAPPVAAHRAVVTPSASASPGTWDEGPGPALLTSPTARLAALTCEGDLDEAALDPVLLVPGTQVYARENWEPSYLPVLLERGHAVCLVDLPQFGTRDIQASSGYVATAIRAMAAMSDRDISIIGHSQGAFLPHVALRIWPDLSPHVEDVVGVAGVYDRGSNALRGRCRTSCTPVLHQLATGSAFLANIGKRRLPAGPAYTNIGSLGDRTVTPQPAANQQPRASSILIQDLCPGRVIPLSEHAMIIGDAAALALVLDALDHPGPASVARVDTGVCEIGEYPGFDSAAYIAVAALAELRAGTPSANEPRRYCRHQPTCRKPRLRGYLTTRPRYRVGGHRVTLRTTAELHGRIKIVLGGRTITRTVDPGPVTLRIRRPANRARLTIKTRPAYYRTWTIEHTRWIGRPEWS